MIRKPFEKKDIKQHESSPIYYVFIFIIITLNALCINSGQSVVTELYAVVAYRCIGYVSIFILFIVITLRSTSR